MLSAFLARVNISPSSSSSATMQPAKTLRINGALGPLQEFGVNGVMTWQIESAAGGSRITVSYPTNTMTYEQRLQSMRGNNYAFSHAVAHHEMIPGHNLVGFMGQRFNGYRAAPPPAAATRPYNTVSIPHALPYYPNRANHRSHRVGSIYTGERPLTRSSARGEPDWGPLPDAWRIDASVGYKLQQSKRISYQVNLNVQNVFDREDLYYLATWDRTTIDPGRLWRLSLSGRF